MSTLSAIKNLGTAPGPALRALWSTFSKLPGGTLLFSRALGRVAPYTGSIRAEVQELGDGMARVVMKDRRRVRNHLRSVHAVALVNLAEVSTGLAALSALPDDARAILTGLSIEYLKKARGTLTAECRTAPIRTSEEREVELEVAIQNENKDVVARAKARWKIGPRAA